MKNYMPWKTIIAIASVFFLRVFGFMVVLPLIMHNSNLYDFSTPFLLGVAIGIYGLMQALFNLYFGAKSDVLGRKTVVFGGLCLIVVGSLIAAFSSSVYGLILGRAVQGSGAIGSTLMATLADVVPSEKRGQAMACVGACIGASFWLAIILGPILFAKLGLSNIFLMTALLALIAICVVHIHIPNIKPKSNVLWKKSCFEALKTSAYYPYNTGVATLHAVFTMVMAFLPVKILSSYDVDMHSLWYFYAGYLLLSLVVSLPLIVCAERKKKVMHAIYAGFVLALIACLGFFGGVDNILILSLFVVSFFAGFTVLESLLMANVSRLADSANRGAIMGVYSTSQFLGIFFGGFFGGVFSQNFVIDSVFLVSFALLLLWGIYLLTSKSKNKV
jgi:predicted MFS family arabinose efflux permease